MNNDIKELDTPKVQRQLALNASHITFYHSEIHKERKFLKSEEVKTKPRDDFDTMASVSAMRFYKAMLRKYVPLQKALKQVIKSRKKSNFPDPKTTAPINVH